MRSLKLGTNENAFFTHLAVPLPHFLSKYKTRLRVAKEVLHTPEIEQFGSGITRIRGLMELFALDENSENS